MTQTTKTTNKAWNEEAVNTLNSLVGNQSPVSAEVVEQAAEALGRTVRSISSKLRKLGHDVVSMAKSEKPTFTADETADLENLVNSNPGAYTYKEIAERFMDGKFNAKQIQGKLLALELTGNVKPAEKIEVASKYTPEEEEQFVAMANAGASVEDIAQALGREINSIRGKGLSLLRKEQISKLPAQKTSHAQDNLDPVEALGDNIANMTVAEIAAAVNKTDRGVKTLLTRRGIKCADYDGAAKREKAEAKKTEA